MEIRMRQTATTAVKDHDTLINTVFVKAFRALPKSLHKTRSEHSELLPMDCEYFSSSNERITTRCER